MGGKPGRQRRVLLLGLALAAAGSVLTGVCQEARNTMYDDATSVTNWASAEQGARLTPGPRTEFLGDQGVDGLATGRPLIFRHGPRDLEKVILVELARPVMVRAVTFGTAIEDLVRVPTGVEVSFSLTGKPNSYRPAGAADRVVAHRTLVAVEPPTPARFVRFSFRDTSGGSRIMELGVFSGAPDVVRESLGGFDPPGEHPPGTLTVAEVEEIRARSGPRGDMDLTFCCGGIEYSAPPLPGPGSLLDRFLAEDSHIRRQLAYMRRALPVYAALGVTAMQTYVRWNFVEEQPGVWDFSIYDAFVDLFEQNGLQWVPLLILGPAYTLPEWYRRSDPGFLPYRCLEHDQDNLVASIWSPSYRQQVERFLRAFADHYGKRGSLQQVMVGISGIFGEDLYPHDATRDWTTNATGDYHTHFGWWAGDPCAREDFRRHLQARYRSIARLNAAWGETFASFEDVQPRPPERLKTARARLDFLEWYTGSMDEALEHWLRTLRRELPQARIQVSCGGHGIPRMGADFPQVARLAARYRAGVRLTNEGPDYRQNVAMTRWLSAACRYYGAWLGLEPASLQVDASSIVHRIYNAATSGAEELFCYPSHLANRRGYTALAENLRFLRRGRPVLQVAYWIPRTHLRAVGDTDYLGQMISLRSVTDFDAVDSLMIADGALRRYRALVMGQGHIEEPGVLRAIERWVRGGGVLLRLNPEPLTTPEGSTAFQPRLFGEEKTGERRLGDGLALLDTPRAPEDFGAAAARLLARAGELTGKPLLPPLRGLREGVYAARMEQGLLFLNTTASRVTVTQEPAPGQPDARIVTVPANGIAASGTAEPADQQSSE